MLGALFGRKIASSGTVGRATTAVRGWTRAGREKGDVKRAQEDAAKIDAEIQQLEQDFERATEEFRDAYDPTTIELETLEVRPRKTDLNPDPVRLVWTPWMVDSAGIAEPAWE